MHYEGNIIRPPSEANSILLQVTVGCSRNKCTFCGTYVGERFRIKKDSVIMEDIEFAARYSRRQRRIFLCDGDALIIPQERLLKILQAIQERQGLKIACIEEIAFRLNYIDGKQLRTLARHMLKNEYGQYLMNILEESEDERNAGKSS